MDEDKLIKLSNLLADSAIKILTKNAENKTTPIGSSLAIVKCAAGLASDLIRLQITQDKIRI